MCNSHLPNEGLRQRDRDYQCKDVESHSPPASKVHKIGDNQRAAVERGWVWVHRDGGI